MISDNYGLDWDAILEDVFRDRVAAQGTDHLLIMILALSERFAEVERRLALTPAPLAEFSVPMQTAANRLHLSKQRVWQLTKNGTLKSKLIGGQRLISEASLRALEQLDD